MNDRLGGPGDRGGRRATRFGAGAPLVLRDHAATFRAAPGVIRLTGLSLSERVWRRALT